jgi:hypothetical protein
LQKLTTVALLYIVTVKEIAKQYNNGVHVFWDECDISSLTEVFGTNWHPYKKPLRIIGKQLSAILFWVAFQPQVFYHGPVEGMKALTGTRLGKVES